MCMLEVRIDGWMDGWVGGWMDGWIEVASVFLCLQLCRRRLTLNKYVDDNSVFY